MSNHAFGWAYIGSGGICTSTSKEVMPTGRHRMVSIYSRNPKHCQKFAEKYGAKICTSLEEAVTMDGVEGVYIGTPVTTHLKLAKQVLEAGKPVLMEKPFGLNRKQTKELFDLAAEKGLYIGEAMWTRFCDVAPAVKKWVDSGAIGQVKEIRGAFSLPIIKEKKVVIKSFERLAKPETGGGALLDCGIYPLMYVHYLMGMPETLTCKTNLLWSGVDRENQIRLTYANGATVDISSCLTGKFDKEMTIRGEKGTISVPGFWFADKATLETAEGKQVFTAKHSYVPEFDQVAKDIRAGKLESEQMPHQATLDVMEMLDECRRQGRVHFPGLYETQASDRFGSMQMRYSLMTLSMIWDEMLGRMNADRCCRLAKEKGLKYLDLLETELQICGVQKMQKALEEHNLNCSCLISVIQLFHPKTDLEKALKKAFETAAAVKAPRVMIVPSVAKDEKYAAGKSKAELQKVLVDSYKKAVQMAEPYGVEVMFENTPVHYLPLSSASDCLYLLKNVPGLKLTFDTTNMKVANEESELEFYEAVKDYVAHVHMKDAAYGPSGEQCCDGRKLQLAISGEGMIQLKECVQALHRNGYDGVIAIEYCPPKGKGNYNNHSTNLQKHMDYICEKL